MDEGPLVGGQEVGHALRQEAFGVAASTVAERHDEHVHLDPAPAQPDRDLPPVHLGLFARTGLEAALGEAEQIGLGTQSTVRSGTTCYPIGG